MFGDLQETLNFKCPYGTFCTGIVWLYDIMFLHLELKNGSMLIFTSNESVNIPNNEITCSTRPQTSGDTNGWRRKRKNSLTIILMRQNAVPAVVVVLLNMRDHLSVEWVTMITAIASWVIAFWYPWNGIRMHWCVSYIFFHSCCCLLFAVMALLTFSFSGCRLTVGLLCAANTNTVCSYFRFKGIGKSVWRVRREATVGDAVSDRCGVERISKQFDNHPKSIETVLELSNMLDPKKKKTRKNDVSCIKLNDTTRYCCTYWRGTWIPYNKYWKLTRTHILSYSRQRNR